MKTYTNRRLFHHRIINISRIHPMDCRHKLGYSYIERISHAFRRQVEQMLLVPLLVH